MNKSKMKTIKAENSTIKEIIEFQIKLLGDNADLNHIDVSEVTDMCNLFNNFSFKEFKGDISQWNTSNVTNMSWMFCNSKFNGDISKWNTSKVKDMRRMFCLSKFNGDINDWDVSNVKNMGSMFYGAEFSGDLIKWDISKVNNLESIFEKYTNNDKINMSINQKIILPLGCVVNSIFKKNKR